jgi:hypothetical protein
MDKCYGGIHKISIFGGSQMRRIFLAIVIVTLLESIVSCAEQKGTVDREASKQWLEQLTCQFPCWENINPQETKNSDVVPMLKEKGIDVTFAGDEGISFQKNKVTGTIDHNPEGFVDVISLTVTDQRIALDDIVQTMGPPAEVIIYYCDPDNKCSIALPYPDQETILELYLKDVGKEKTQIELQAESQVRRIKLIGRDVHEYLKSDSSAIVGESAWHGYGIYP